MEGTHGVRNGKESERERISVNGVLLEGDYLATLSWGCFVSLEVSSLEGFVSQKSAVREVL